MTRRTIKLFVACLLGLLILVVASYFVFPGLILRLALRTERMTAGVTSQTLEAAGHQIVYLSGGTGEALVLLHGFGADKDNWTRVAKYLTPHFRVIAPDLPGFGESTRDRTAHYAINDQVERLHAFVTSLSLTGFHLGGNSMGGQLAGAYAARYPDQVQSLWLLAPGGVSSAQPSELAEHLKKGQKPLLVRTVEDFERLVAFAL